MRPPARPALVGSAARHRPGGCPLIAGALALAVGILAASLSPAHAEDCWQDVTTHGCTPPNHLLQFKNNCGGSRTINVCTKDSDGNYNRYAQSAGGGMVAHIYDGSCNRSVRYTYRRDGGVPNCPQ